SPLVEAVDGKDYFPRPEIAFANVVVEDVLDGMGFVGLGFDGKQACGFVDDDDVVIFVENLQAFRQAAEFC
ncbi:MAG: hypothetical protein KJ757_04100, partial [Planctomycetes bacterium]|nr:hypothetical protein [Planctomycetota bacterium]